MIEEKHNVIFFLFHHKFYLRSYCSHTDLFPYYYENNIFFSLLNFFFPSFLFVFLIFCIFRHQPIFGHGKYV